MVTAQATLRFETWDSDVGMISDDFLGQVSMPLLMKRISRPACNMIATVGSLHVMRTGT